MRKFLALLLLALACNPAPKMPAPLDAPAQGLLLYTRPDTLINGLGMAVQLLANPSNGTCTVRLRMASNRPDSLHIAYMNAQIATEDGVRTTAAYNESFPAGIRPGEEAYLEWEFTPTNSTYFWKYAQYRGDFPPSYALPLDFLQTIKGFGLNGELRLKPDTVAYRQYLGTHAREKGMSLYMPAPNADWFAREAQCLRALLPDSVDVPKSEIRENELMVGGVIARISALAEGDSVHVFLGASNQNDQLILINPKLLGLLAGNEAIAGAKTDIQSVHAPVAGKDGWLTLRKGERFIAKYSYGMPQPQQELLAYSLAGFVLNGPMKPIFCDRLPLEKRALP